MKSLMERRRTKKEILEDIDAAIEFLQWLRDEVKMHNKDKAPDDLKHAIRTFKRAEIELQAAMCYSFNRERKGGT